MSSGSSLESRIGISPERLAELVPAERTRAARERHPDLHSFLDDGRALEERGLPARVRVCALALREAVAAVSSAAPGEAPGEARGEAAAAEIPPAEAIAALPDPPPAATLEARIVTDPEVRADYARDQNVYLSAFFTRRLTHAVPDIVFQPVSTAEVAAAEGREQVRKLAELRDLVRDRIARALPDAATEAAPADARPTTA